MSFGNDAQSFEHRDAPTRRNHSADTVLATTSADRFHGRALRAVSLQSCQRARGCSPRPSRSCAMHRTIRKCWRSHVCCTTRFFWLKRSTWPLRFEGERQCRAEFARAQGMTEHRARLVWDGVVFEFDAVDRSLQRTEWPCVRRASVSIGWMGHEMLTASQIATIVDAFPRLGTAQFTHAVRRIVESRPATTYDNFARDFGERFVPGLPHDLPTVDFLLGAPFDE